MGTWIKTFNDGSIECGSDRDIQNKKASWTRGRLTDIESVKILEKNLCGILTIPNTEWHQYDRYMASLMSVKTPNESQSHRTARVVQAKITPEHVDRYIHCVHMAGIVLVDLGNEPNNDNILITKDCVGLWITLYILCNGKIGIVICQKGAFNGDDQVLR
jgi:hypothetical protein